MCLKVDVCSEGECQRLESSWGPNTAVCRRVVSSRRHAYVSVVSEAVSGGVKFESS